MAEETQGTEAAHVPLTAAERLWRIRHSTSHIMAQAVAEMFPEAKLAIGPPIADGFYYDFDLPRTLTPDDLDALEKKMKRIVKGNHPFTTWTKPVDEAMAFFKELDQPYKVELIEDLKAKGETEVRFYQQDTFIDLCAGPHAQRTGSCKAYKLLKVAGAYWRGDSDKPMLQRIYGTAWKNKTDLKAHLEVLEEAKKRDHRRLGKELDLFSFHRESPGAVFWHPKGWTVYKQLQAMSREIHERDGYVEICNPIIYNESLYHTSGHWDHYHEHMYKLESEGETYCIKPMNCPDTMLFYKTKKHSYRELPLRVYEGQILHRNELSGVLNGLLRVRQFAQDDSHIFATEEQIESEISGVIKMVDEIYRMFDLDYKVEFSTRPDKFMGEPELWDMAEGSLRSALEANDLDFVVNEGDGAFYGPKIDFHVVDAIGRTWQCATVQLDFQLPRRFELTYTDTNNTQQTPVVIHRALFGSLERFIGILIEHLAGVFPTWLAPVQAVFIPMGEEAEARCHEVAKELRAAGVRVEVDDRAQKLGYRIRESEIAKVPYMLVVGGREVESGEFSVRTYQDGDRGKITFEALRDEIVDKIKNRTFDVTLKKIAWSEEGDDDDDIQPGDY